FGLEIDVLDEARMKELGMGALLGVSQGSAEPAKLIVLSYTPQTGSNETVAIVGKGITFDTGGISIKPADGMEKMKYDMAGGATRIVDLATLTGAVSIALGDVYVAVLGTDQNWVNLIIEAGKRCGEKLWQLPLDRDYREQIKSEIADIKNTGGRKAGTITAAYF